MEIRTQLRSRSSPEDRHGCGVFECFPPQRGDAGAAPHVVRLRRSPHGAGERRRRRGARGPARRSARQPGRTPVRRRLVHGGAGARRDGGEGVRDQLRRHLHGHILEMNEWGIRIFGVLVSGSLLSAAEKSEQK
ncbi:hypothetical protein CDAR_608491 [Caerostris darwini]|uniref:Uncharacterized protein n=1 Tax=Caerostris darwini TaxID=1538125 RepID=A0AAV4WIR8_9ARAC|nr:hypothetical protein CDAR_608491 [Caerostris darwini]